MDEDFFDFICKRCARALTENKEFIESEQENISEDELHAKAEELCYKKGFCDAMAILKCSQKM
jgi:hypothetical protein